MEDVYKGYSARCCRLQNEVEDVQTKIRKAQGEDERKIAAEVKTDNEKCFSYIRNVRSRRTVAATPPRQSKSNLLTDTVSENLMGLCLGMLTKEGQRTDPTEAQISQGTEKKYHGRPWGMGGR